MTNLVESWITLGLPTLVVLATILAGRFRAPDARVSRTTRERAFWLVAVLAAPAVFIGDARVMAALVVLNLTVGAIEFVPLSRFSMFSTLPDRQRVVFLADGSGSRVNAGTISNLHNHEINKIFQGARRSGHEQHPDWQPHDLDAVGAHFVNEMVIRSAAQRGLGVPRDVRIMIAEISHGGQEPQVEEHELRVIGLEE